MSKMEDYDVIVVGAGCAGLSAALFTGAMNLKTLVLEAENPPKLWSYPRRTFLLEGIPGAELIQRMVKQAEHGVEIRTGEEAIDVDCKEKKIVKTRRKSYACDALILATGSRWKKLNVPGETWLARDTSYCAICDGQFFKGCDVVVVGPGSEAAEEALVLSQTAHNVILVTNSEKADADKSLVEKLKNRGVHIMEDCKVEAIERGELINNVKIRNMRTGETNVVQADGIFVALGVDPKVLKVEKIGVKTHRQGGILVDGRQQTNVGGVFAAGDCTCGGGFCMTTCVGDGVKAGLAVYLYVKRLRRLKT